MFPFCACRFGNCFNHHLHSLTKVSVRACTASAWQPTAAEATMSCTAADQGKTKVQVSLMSLAEEKKFNRQPTVSGCTIYHRRSRDSQRDSAVRAASAPQTGLELPSSAAARHCQQSQSQLAPVPGVWVKKRQRETNQAKSWSAAPKFPSLTWICCRRDWANCSPAAGESCRLAAGQWRRLAEAPRAGAVAPVPF